MSNMPQTTLFFFFFLFSLRELQVASSPPAAPPGSAASGCCGASPRGLSFSGSCALHFYCHGVPKRSTHFHCLCARDEFLLKCLLPKGDPEPVRKGKLPVNISPCPWPRRAPFPRPGWKAPRLADVPYPPVAVKLMFAREKIVQRPALPGSTAQLDDNHVEPSP